MKISGVFGTVAALSLASATPALEPGPHAPAEADPPTADPWADVEIVAHRGASHDAPENTLAAVNLAWEMGADAVEFDVHLTRDGHLVTIHDKDTKRVAGTKLIVVETTLAEMRALDVGRWKDPSFAGEVPPTIDEVLATVPRGEGSDHKRLFVEVKVGPDAVPPLLAALDRADLPPSRTPVISFNYDTCREVKRQRPELPVYLLSGFKESEKGKGGWTPTADELIDQARRANLDGLDLSAKGPVDEAFIRKAEESGLEVLMWTVDDPAVARRLVKAGARAITTNRPDVMLAERRKAVEDPPRGYSIPLIDLADDRERQVVVDREEGQYLGHPTTLLLEDGTTILAVYPKGHGAGAIIYKRSEDGGRTWSDRLPTPENWETSQETPTLYEMTDGEGKKRQIVFSGLYPIRRAYSEDEGRSWTQLEAIGDFGGVVAMSDVVRLGDGRYMALFHDDGRFIAGGPGRHRESPAGERDFFKLYKTLSEDGGLSWSEPEVIAQDPAVDLCEPGAIRSPDGEQIAVLLRENSRRKNAHVIFSEDEGETWTEPRELPGALTGDRHQGVYAPDGRLFISFRDMAHETPTKGDWVAWVGTYQDIVEGREGQYRVRLMDNHHGWDCAYPGVEILPDGTIITTTYGHWEQGEPPYIVSIHLTLEELDDLHQGD